MQKGFARSTTRQGYIRSRGTLKNHKVEFFLSNLFQGKALADKIGAAGYVECSALTGDKVDEVFNTAIRVHMQPPGKEKKKKERKCFIL